MQNQKIVGPASGKDSEGKREKQQKNVRISEPDGYETNRKGTRHHISSMIRAHHGLSSPCDAGVPAISAYLNKESWK